MSLLWRYFLAICCGVSRWKFYILSVRLHWNQYEQQILQPASDGSLAQHIEPPASSGRSSVWTAHWVGPFLRDIVD